MVLQRIIERLNIILNMKFCQGLLYIRLILKKKECVKMKFVKELERGMAVYIPEEISIDSLPMSYQYYDSLLIYAKDNISENTKSYNQFRTNYLMQFEQNETLLHKLLPNYKKTAPKPSKMTFQHKVVESANETQVNHYVSPHVMSLQKSKYVQIEDNINLINL